MTIQPQYAPGIATPDTSFDALLRHPDDNNHYDFEKDLAERDRVKERERLTNRTNEPPDREPPEPARVADPEPDRERYRQARPRQRSEHRTIPLALPELGLTREDIVMIAAALADWAQGSGQRVRRYGEFCWRHPEFIAQREDW